MKKKIVFLDIDGTLTTFKGIFPESAQNALRQAKANGHELVICTGRTITQIYRFLLESDCFSGIVCGAGSDVRRNGKQEFYHYIAAEELQLLVRYLEKIDAYYFLQCESGLFATQRVIDATMCLLGDENMTVEKRDETFGKIYRTDHPEAHRDVYKVIFYQAEESIEEIRKNCGTYFDVMEGSYGLTEKSDGEITVNGYNKSFGMKEYLKLCGAAQEDTIAFGDGPNDFEMLEFADIGVAMGNGREDLKAIADMVTDDVDRDGLANAFRKLGLID